MTDTRDRFNGWANRETWSLALYLHNDEGLQSHMVEVLQQAISDPDNQDPCDALQDAVTCLLHPGAYRALHGEDQPLELGVMAADIGSLWRIDWREVANSFTDLLDAQVVDA